MDQIGQIQRWALFYSGIVWGILALLISATFFFCEYFPQRCENFVMKLRKRFNQKKNGHKK